MQMSPLKVDKTWPNHIQTNKQFLLFNTLISNPPGERCVALSFLSLERLSFSDNPDRLREEIPFANVTAIKIL